MAGRGRQTRPQKNYAVGLEIPCRGGAFYWAPEIPSEVGLAGAIPSVCERVHNRAHSFQNSAGLRSRAHPAVGADLKPRWLDHPVSYCFSLARRVQLLILPFQLTFRRGRRIRSGESGGPPLFEPSLKVERDTAHHQNSGFGRPGLKFLNWRSQPGRYPLRRMGLADDLIDVIAIDAVKRAQVESDPRGLDAYQDHRA